jgi:hypothetical protein
MQDNVLFPTGQYQIDVLQSIGHVGDNMMYYTSFNSMGSLSLKKASTMIMGLALTPALASAACAKNAEAIANIQNMISIADDALRPNVQYGLPSFYIDEGVMCCDIRDHRAEPFHVDSDVMKTSALATALFEGTQPMVGIEYAHLSRLVKKNAKKSSSIPGML